MTDPSYINFTYRFEDAKNLPRGSVVLCRMKSIDLIKYIGTAPPPGYLAPNIIIGLDNILETAANDTTLIKFDTPHLEDMVPIVNTLGHYEHMKPYDWGVASIFYNTSIVLELNRADDNRIFNLKTFLDSGLISHFVAINPSRDTAGLAFFMWTVAELGDPAVGIAGKIPYEGGYVAWWRAAFEKGLTVVESWDDAFNDFIDPTNPNINIMSSYGASPAYDWCNYGIQETRSIVSWFDNTRYGWAQVEGYVLVNDTTVARDFIDFFITTLQDKIALHQYMNPVNKKVTLEQCFIDVSIQPQNVTLYNTFPIAHPNITTTAMRENRWFNTWNDLYKQYYKPYVYPTNAPSSNTSSSTGSSTGKPGTGTGTGTGDAHHTHPMMILVSIIAVIMVGIM